ncbi:MAG: hypothetical protein IAE81_13920 [Caldilineaceae bacterium]|jgi:hypothetical protein|nr:hypothetical protein [Caldilineaceae bacterium]
METAFLDEVTKVLTEFAQIKLSAQLLELIGPTKEGLNYRWRLMSTRYREVVILLISKKHFFGKPTPEYFEVHGLDQTKQLEPSLAELRTFLAGSELALTG